MAQRFHSLEVVSGPHTIRILDGLPRDGTYAVDLQGQILKDMWWCRDSRDSVFYFHRHPSGDFESPVIEPHQCVVINDFLEPELFELS